MAVVPVPMPILAVLGVAWHVSFCCSLSFCLNESRLSFPRAVFVLLTLS